MSTWSPPMWCATPLRMEEQQHIIHPGTLNNHFLMDVWWFPTVFYAMIGNHPVETNHKKWLFGVPGSSEHNEDNTRMVKHNYRHILTLYKNPMPTYSTESSGETSLFFAPVVAPSCIDDANPWHKSFHRIHQWPHNHRRPFSSRVEHGSNKKTTMEVGTSR